MGARWSMFEVLTASFFDRFRHTLKFWRGLDFMGAGARRRRRDALRTWMAAVDAHPSFKFTAREGEYYIKGYASYADNDARTLL